MWVVWWWRFQKTSFGTSSFILAGANRRLFYHFQSSPRLLFFSADLDSLYVLGWYVCGWCGGGMHVVCVVVA